MRKFKSTRITLFLLFPLNNLSLLWLPKLLDPLDLSIGDCYCGLELPQLLQSCNFLELYFFCLHFTVTNLLHRDTASTNCLRGLLSNGSKWQRNMLILFMVIISYVAPVQCFAGADVLRWRCFYAAEDNAWKAHHREVFDHGIREALCCLGGVKYL